MGSEPKYYTNDLINGRLTPWIAQQVAFSVEGCPYRGSTVCHACPFARTIPELCDYKCSLTRKYLARRFRYDCQHRAYCKCGHDQTERLRAWGLI